MKKHSHVHHLFLLLLPCLLFCVLPQRLYAQAGSFDPSFNVTVAITPGGTPLVLNVSIQPDGKIIAGGQFTQVDGTTHNYIARLNADGSIDSGFSGSVDSLVYTTLVQPDGKIFLGGTITQADGVEGHQDIVRLNADGSLDRAFAQQLAGMY